MTCPRASSHHGMTLIELMMALALTAMVAAAIGTMIAAVSSGEMTRRDNRAYVIRAHAAKTRLAAYLARSKAILHTDGTDLVVWMHDGRRSDTVHASEIRWLKFNETEGLYDVHFVKFPDGWTDVARAIEDDEYNLATTWEDVRLAYKNDNYLGTLTLLEGLAAITINLDEPVILDNEQVEFEFKFLTSIPNQVVEQSFVVALMQHHPPVDF